MKTPVTSFELPTADLACLARVAGGGGKAVMPRTDRGPPGFIALIEATEGNRVGRHLAQS